jgi:hypothetical protein
LRRKSRKERRVQAVVAPFPSNDGLADANELVRIVRREREAFPEAGFSPDQDVTAQVRIVEFDAPSNPFASAEHGLANLDCQDFPVGGSSKGEC